MENNMISMCQDCGKCHVCAIVKELGETYISPKLAEKTKQSLCRLYERKK